MKPFFKYICLILSALLMLTSCGCGGDETADRVIRLALDTAPVNIDPQLAQSESELTIVRNTFEGLFRIIDGKAEKAACEDYSVSDDGLTYTFTLIDGAKWSDGTAVTADDFVFGILRALKPETKAPYADRLYCIAGAEDYASGNPVLPQITAQDERTLVIKLNEQCSGLPEILSTSAAMPCNKAFFEKTGGRYGLSSSDIISNGPFYVSKWSVDKDGAVRLTRNKEYSGRFVSKPSAVTMAFDVDIADRITNVSKDYTDIARIDIQGAGKAHELGMKTVSFKNTVWVLIINPETSVIGQDTVADALNLSLSRGSLESVLPDGFSLCNSMAAGDLTLAGGSTYRSNVPAHDAAEYDIDKAKSTFLTAVKSAKSLPELTLLYVDTAGMKNTANHIVQGWQQSLGAYINTSAVTESEMISKISSGGYQLALVPFSSDDGSALGLFRQFVGSSGGKFGFSNSSYDQILSGLSYSDGSSELASALCSAEQKLLSDPHIIPLFESSVCYAVSGSVTGLQSDIRLGRFDFCGTGK